MSKFHMKLAEMKPGKRYFRINLPSFLDIDDASTYQKTPSIIKEVCGDEMDYGKLFAYLFRRFGYPNYGWDDYKQLARYILTTPLPYMLLEIVPYVGNSTNIQFNFIIEHEYDNINRDYERREYLQYKERMLNWIEENNKLPYWCDDAVAFLNEENNTSLSWRELFDSFSLIHEIDPNNKENRIDIGNQWIKSITMEYEEVEPASYNIISREYDWNLWDDDDPLKVCAEAIRECLHDLSTIVCVRDNHINAYGRVTDNIYDEGTESDDEEDLTYLGVEYAKSSGHASGFLGNEHPEKFNKILSLISKLGDGDNEKGMDILLEKYQD